MSKIRDGEEDMHYSDWSHRWIPPNFPDKAMDAMWQRMMREHMAEHRYGPVAEQPISEQRRST